MCTKAQGKVQGSIPVKSCRTLLINTSSVSLLLSLFFYIFIVLLFKKIINELIQFNNLVINFRLMLGVRISMK